MSDFRAEILNRALLFMKTGIQTTQQRNAVPGVCIRGVEHLDSDLITVFDCLITWNIACLIDTDMYDSTIN
jgi:hypothetical protein